MEPDGYEARRLQIVRAIETKRGRDAFLTWLTSVAIARQIVALRHDRGWSQADLAQRVGTHQEVICRYESERYHGRTISMLKRIASAFDVAFVSRFESWSDLIDYLAREADGVPSAFDDDQGLRA